VRSCNPRLGRFDSGAAPFPTTERRRTERACVRRIVDREKQTRLPRLRIDALIGEGAFSEPRHRHLCGVRRDAERCPAKSQRQEVTECLVEVGENAVVATAADDAVREDDFGVPERLGQRVLEVVKPPSLSRQNR
jgi:hypothetical protein